MCVFLLLNSIEGQLFGTSLDRPVWHKLLVVGWVVVDVPGVHLFELSGQSHVPWDSAGVSWLNWNLLDVTNVFDDEYLG